MEESRSYVRIYGGVVVEFFTTTGDITTMFPPDMIWVDITDIPGVEYNWVATNTDGVWTFAPYVPPPPTYEQILAAAIADRDYYLRSAHDRMITLPLQYAFDLGLASPDEIVLLSKWKQYCLEVSRVEHQDGFPENINWPSPPEMGFART